MSEQKTQPTFNVRPAVTTIQVGDVVYNAEPAGPGNWHKLRQADYGQDFRQGTFGENFTLAHSGYINQKSENEQTRKHARNVVQVVRKQWLTGNTALYGGEKELIFAQDFPEVQEGNIVMNQKDLEARLGKHQVGDVVISDDCLVRAMPREKVREGECNTEQMLKESYPIFLTGDAEAPEKMADMMQTVEKPGYLWVPRKNKVRVPGLGESDVRLFLVGLWFEFFVDRYSFGVRRQ